MLPSHMQARTKDGRDHDMRRAKLPYGRPNSHANAFLEELEEHGITHDLQDVNELAPPNVRLPWTE